VSELELEVDLFVESPVFWLVFWIVQSLFEPCEVFNLWFFAWVFILLSPTFSRSIVGIAGLGFDDPASGLVVGSVV